MDPEKDHLRDLGRSGNEQPTTESPTTTPTVQGNRNTNPNDLEKGETDVESAQSGNNKDDSDSGGDDDDDNNGKNNHSPPEASEKDPNLVEWDGPNDPENPKNWPTSKKWINTMALAAMTLWITFASSVFSEATAVTSQVFGVSVEVMTLGTSLMLFGYMLGPLIWAPFSELYGRLPPLFIGYAVFAIFQIPVAVAQNVETIMLCRFLGGTFGCAPLSVVGGALADMWDPINMGVAISLFASATFLGPIFGPILGGFITSSHLGWRWTAWITLIASSFFGLIALLVCRESYAPVLLQRRAKRLRKETRNWAFHSQLDESSPTLKDLVFKYFLRPFAMLMLEPILLLLTIYMGFIYGVLYLFFESYPVAFMEVRHWTHPGVAALPFLGILVGILIGVAFIIVITKTRFARKLKKHGRFPPEERLLPMVPASILLPIGLFWFGWTSSSHVHWAPQVIAGAPIGFGILIIFMQGLTYIVDVYLMFANSAIAGNTLFRSALGGSFPLFATQMYHRLGVNWASSLLGFLTIVMIPIPILFIVYGKRIRAWSKFTPKL